MEAVEASPGPDPLPVKLCPTGPVVGGPRGEPLGKPPLPGEVGQDRKVAAVAGTLGACGVAWWRRGTGVQGGGVGPHLNVPATINLVGRGSLAW